MTTAPYRGRDGRVAQAAREELSKANLAEYKRRLDETFVMKDLKKYRKIPEFLHSNSMSSVFIQGLSALQRRPGFASMARTS